VRSTVLRRLRAIALVLLALLGAFVGAMVAPSSTTQVGPLTVEVSVRPSLRPGVAVALPPVGDVRFDTHRTPLAVAASVRSVDLGQARRLVASPAALTALQVSAPNTVRAAALRALLWTLGCALVAAAALVGLASRSWQGIAAGAAICLGLVVALGALTAATFDGKRLAQPRFTGLLSSAPYVQRRTETLAQRLESYRSGLSDFVQSVTTLYAVGDRLPTFDPGSGEDVVTVLHISDLHLNPLGYDLTDRLVEQFKVDAVIDSGDLSTWGSTAEQAFVGRIGGLDVPYVFVRGNHDSEGLAAAVGRQPGAVVLDGEVAEVAGLRIAGIADPRNTPAEGSEDTIGKDAVTASVQRLADVVEEYDAANPDAPVQIAVVHDPTRLTPLRGAVPLVLSGHMHERAVSEQDGTRLMVQGSTGGAGITAAGLQRLTDGEPLPLEATLLYLRRSGPDAGRLLAYDEVTVGGLGLTSVSIDRTVVGSDDDDEPEPAPSPSTVPPPTGATAGPASSR
jgi:predicted MPP superfamily phosphohydrolase